MQPEPAEKRFDCVKYMRRERDRISAEIATMDHRELVLWLRSFRYSDPALQRLADRLQTGKREDGDPASKIPGQARADCRRRGRRRDQLRRRSSG